MEKGVQAYFDLFMEQFPQLDLEANKFTRSFLILKKYDKKEFLFKSDEVQKEVGYVCQGLLRKYYINEKGNEIITGFSRENDYATDYPSFLKQKPSKYNIECLEPSIIVKMPYEKLQEAYRKHGVAPLQFSDDFAYFQKSVPGVYFFLGGSNYENEIVAMPHTPTFAIDEECIRTGVNYFSSMIVERLLDVP